MYFMRLVRRSSATELLASAALKIGPHVGMSREPCAAITSSPEIFDLVDANGNFPPARLLIKVRSLGAVLSAEAAGPLPWPSGPWHAEQYSLNVAAPDTSEIDFAGSCLIVFCVAVLVWALADAANTVTIHPIP